VTAPLQPHFSARKTEFLQSTLLNIGVILNRSAFFGFKNFAMFKFHFVFNEVEEEILSAIPVKNVFTKGFSAVNENDSVSKCLELFKKEMPPVIVVLDDRGKYAGVISRRWVIRSRVDPATTKVKTLMRSAPRVSPEFSLSKAAKLMIESGVRQLPLFEKNKLVGFVTDEDIIHGAVTQEWGNTAIEKIMTKAPQVIDANRSVGAVLSLFREHGGLSRSSYRRRKGRGRHKHPRCYRAGFSTAATADAG